MYFLSILATICRLPSFHDLGTIPVFSERPHCRFKIKNCALLLYTVRPTRFFHIQILHYFILHLINVNVFHLSWSIRYLKMGEKKCRIRSKFADLSYSKVQTPTLSMSRSVVRSYAVCMNFDNTIHRSVIQYK